MDAQTWNEFVLSHGPRSGTFLQSFEWGEFQKAMGKRIERVQHREQGNIVSQGVWIEHPVSFFGSGWVCPKGPIGKTTELPSISQQALFLRSEPASREGFELWKQIPDVHPSHTLMTDVHVDTETLLARMHSKTRYNIRVAQKHGVEVDLHFTDFDRVWEVFLQTAKRDGFRLHDKSYYALMLKTLNIKALCARMAVAHKAGEILAVCLIVDFGNVRTYLHGASSNTHREYMAPYALHYALMVDAKTCGLAWYDWWGVAPRDIVNHPWEGISRFKRGFGGEEVQTPGTLEFTSQSLRYVFYKTIREMKKNITKVLST